jgi:RNA 3'-terminal phosphate cyclase (ATP)
VQTVVPALALAAGDSTLAVTGGTHVPWAPTFEYLARHWTVMLARLGLEVEARLEQAGFYPRGGGSVRVSVRGRAMVKPLVALERGGFVRAAGVSLASGLPRHVAERQAQELERGLGQLGLEGAGGEVAVEVVEPRAVDPGTAVYVEAQFTAGRAAFTALGQRGKPAEQVARKALNELARYLKTDAAFDYHLADQLLVPLALASGESRFTTSAVSEHLLTNAHVINLFLGPVVEVRGKVGEPGEVRVTPVGS